MTIQQFLSILRARSKVVFITLFAIVFVALVISLVMPKQYTASTAVVIDVKSPDPIAGLVLPGMISPGYMATQVDIINSDRVAQRVVKLLHMDENPAFRQKWLEATDGKGIVAVWAAEQLQKKLDVKPSRESSVIDISFRGSDPAFVANVANAFAQAYVDVNLDLKVDPARNSASWFEEQTKQARNKLEAAQRALSSYQQKTGIVATEERLDNEIAKLNDLSTQLTVVQGENADSHSKIKSVSNPETLPEVLQSPLINSLKSEIALLESKLQNNSATFGKNYPQTKSTESELASLKSRLASEIRAITGSYGTSYSIGKQKEKELLDALETQKKRVLDLNRERDEMNVLTRDVESAQHDFEGVSQRAALTRLESLSVQTNAGILSKAAEPVEPSRPKILHKVHASIFLGTLFGICMALVLELKDRKIRSPQDLADAIELPLLAVISSTLPAPTQHRLLLFPRNKSGTRALQGNRLLES